LSRVVFLPDPASLELQRVSIEGNRVTLFVQVKTSNPSCPQCKQHSSRVHSRYTRTLADLPWQGRAARLVVEVRRFFCAATECPRKTFAERLPKVAAPYARITTRLNEIHRLIGHALGGEAGARLALPLGMPISPDTLLRRVKSSPRPQTSNVRVLGVDDWAWKKGQRYGTILCDLERHRVVDLLPVRSTDSFADWLKAHPDVEIISRDRGEEYTKGATQGAPAAVQVADRWHLLVNAREALTRVVDRHHTQVAKVAADIVETQRSLALMAKESKVPVPAQLPKESKSLAMEQSRNRRARRLERFEAVMALARQGVPLRAIARRLGMSPRTVRLWTRIGSFPERAKRRSSSRIDPYVDFLKRRWQEGCRSATRLTEELHAIGFTGSYVMVQRCVRMWREGTGTTTTATLAPKARASRRPSSKRVSWWLLKAGANSSSEETAFVNRLVEACPELKIATALAREFAEIVRNRLPGAWECWLAKVREPGVARELRSFADGLKQDEAAVKAALTLEWSNGQVEGQINRLKLLKRQMFGRAGFVLLRSRVLQAM
jgi:transposase